jgi:hypothetical protein
MYKAGAVGGLLPEFRRCGSAGSEIKGKSPESAFSRVAYGLQSRGQNPGSVGKHW